METRFKFYLSQLLSSIIREIGVAGVSYLME
jgi:hypothetical protein